MIRSATGVALTLAIFVTVPAWAQQRAFPEAEGYGAFSTGGRGGAVYHVTSLSDNGSQGTLRWGLENASAGQPLTVVFDVGGYITLNSKLGLTRDNVTIAGQTAPGGGIGLKGDQFSIGADNVIVRHMRFRPGKEAGRVDAMSVSSGHDIILDHISAGFSYDGNFDANGTELIRDFTVQYAANEWGLETHSTGSLLQNGDRVSFHHNLYGHNHTRNPKARENHFDWVNNVVYDYDRGFIAGDSDTSEVFWTVNFDRNTYIAGSGDGGDPPIESGKERNYGLYFGTNALDDDGDAAHDPINYTGNGENANGIEPYIDGSYTWASRPYGELPVRLEDTPQDAYEQVLEQFGATPWNRDEVDQRLHDDVVNRTGTIIRNQIQLTGISNGGFGTLAPGAPGSAPTDTDRDGMPDAWENDNGLNPNDAADRNGTAPTGYTNLEVYLNELGFRHSGTAWRATSGQWNQANAWTDGVGELHDLVYIDGEGGAAGRVSVNSSASPIRAFRVNIGDGTAGAEILQVNSGGLLQVQASITAGSFGDGALQINSGGTVMAESILIANGNGGFDVIGGGSNGSGTVNLAGGTLATTRIVTLDGAGGGSLNLSNGGTIVALRNLDFLSDATLGTGGGVIDTNGNRGVIHGTLSGGGSLTKTGDAALLLLGDNTHAGGTIVRQGAVAVERLSDAGVAGPLGTGRLTLDGGTLHFAGDASSNRGFTVGSDGATLSTEYNNTFQLAGDITASGSGDRTLTIAPWGGATVSSHLDGAIADPAPGSGTGRLTFVKTGSARLFIGADDKHSTYSGDTVIDQGLLYLDFDLDNATPIPFGFSKGNLVVNSGATLGLLDNSLQINGLNDGTDGGGYLGQFVQNRSRTLTLGHGDAPGSFSGVIDGSGLSLTKVGAGTQTLTGPNTYGSATTLSGGVLETNFLADGGQVSGIGQSSSDAANLVLDGGTLRYNSTVDTRVSIDRNFTLTSNGGTLDASGVETISFRDNGGTIAQRGTGDRNLFLIGSNTGWNTLDLALTDPASGSKTSLQKFGTGTWRLLNTGNSYSGDTIIAQGQLLAWSSGVLPTGPGKGDVFLSNGATLNLNNQNHTLNGLFNGPPNDPRGHIVQGGSDFRTLTIGNADADGYYSGTISGSGLALRKIGAGTQILGTPTPGTFNTYTRGTTIEAGTLELISDGAVGQGDVTVLIEAILDLSNTTLTDALGDAADLELFQTDTASSLVDFGDNAYDEAIAALLVNGENLGDGIYTRGNLPRLIAGDGRLIVGDAVVPQPTAAAILLVGGGLLLRRRR